jgi:hypothetical protein
MYRYPNAWARSRACVVFPAAVNPDTAIFGRRLASARVDIALYSYLVGVT